MSGLNSIQIQALVRDMDTSMRRHKGLKRTNPAKYREKVSEENKTLYDVFPTIFEMHYEGKMDDTFFEMLRLRRKIELGEMTEDEASKALATYVALRRWKDNSRNRLRKGRAPKAFVDPNLPTLLHAEVWQRLQGARTRAEVDAAFATVGTLSKASPPKQ